jgi:hypothetical protein
MMKKMSNEGDTVQHGNPVPLQDKERTEIEEIWKSLLNINRNQD